MNLFAIIFVASLTMKFVYSSGNIKQTTGGPINSTNNIFNIIISNKTKIRDTNDTNNLNDRPCNPSIDPLSEELNQCSSDHISWYKGWYSWCSKIEQNLQAAEEEILQHLNTDLHGYYVDIGCPSGKSRGFVWTVSSNEHSNNTPIVLLHGYASGLGVFCLNIDVLAEDRPVYALDVLGFGRSSRVVLADDAVTSEKQIILSLESWRNSLGIQKFIILGHSFGGFIAATYAIQHPDRISHLILADSWGFQDRPLSQSNDSLPFWLKTVNRFMPSFSPFDVLRSAGPLGPILLSKIRPDLGDKFSNLINDSVSLIPRYLYLCNANKEHTGEMMFNSLMSGFRWAKFPIMDRLISMDSNVPITFIYGENSWIRQEPGYQIQKEREFSYVDVEVIADAGHHVYADQPEEFNRLVNLVGEYSDRG